MIVVKNIFTIIYLIACVALIIICAIQTKDGNGASGAITGSSTNNFYEKNKGRTKEGKLKKHTIILGSAYAVATIILAVLYVVVK